MISLGIALALILVLRQIDPDRCTLTFKIFGGVVILAIASVLALYGLAGAFGFYGTVVANAVYGVVGVLGIYVAVKYRSWKRRGGVRN